MLAFLPLVSIFLLLLTPLVILILRLARPRFAYFWLVAVFGALLVWPLVLLMSQNIPQAMPLLSWGSSDLFSISPALLIDSLSWPYAFALATLVLSVILTDVARAWEADWLSWAASLGLAAIGMVAILAGNLLTLLLAWAAIDLAELHISMIHVERIEERERVVIAFSVRVAGILLLLWGDIVARAGGAEFSISAIPPSASIYVLLACGLRLGVIPLNLPYQEEFRMSRGLSTMVRLVPPAASLVLLARTATSSIPPHFTPYLLALGGLAALYAGFFWFIAEDELDGRTFWILGMASMSLAAAVRGQPSASLSWGVAMLLSGGLLFLLSARHRNLLPISLAGFLGLSMLPFTPTWEAGKLYTAPLNIFLLIYVLAQVLFLAGYLRHALRPGLSLNGVERWVWLIYPAGILLLPVAFFLTGIWYWREQGLGPINLGRLFPGVIILALLCAGIILREYIPLWPNRATARLKSIFSFQWLYGLLWRTYHGVSGLAGFISVVLEGEGGVLWALLILTLLIAFIFQGRLGG
jgi:hypothetical protein